MWDFRAESGHNRILISRWQPTRCWVYIVAGQPDLNKARVQADRRHTRVNPSVLMIAQVDLGFIRDGPDASVADALVVGPTILGMPQRNSPAHTFGQHFELFVRTWHRLSGGEIGAVMIFWFKIPNAQLDCIENRMRHCL